VRVLIATDGSDDSVTAARKAVGVLSHLDEIVLVCVIRAPEVATEGQVSGFVGGVADVEAVDAAWGSVEADARSAIERTVEVLPTAASIVEVIETGSAGPMICHVAAERAADVVVVGSRGRGAFKRAFLGSVSGHVVHNAPCPVLVVRHHDD
jgi:nucleotide-binding universal stress UspA family protein